MHINLTNIKKNFLYALKINRVIILLFYLFFFNINNTEPILEKNKIYNQIHYILSIVYEKFLKKIHRLDEDFLLRMIKKETLSKKDHNFKLIKKESNDLYNILKIIKILLHKIKNNFNIIINTEKIELFILIVENELGKLNNINNAFKKALYTITGNEKAYNKKDSLEIFPVIFDAKILDDLGCLTLFWTLYSYEHFSEIFHNSQIENNILSNEEFFVYIYHIYTYSLNKTYNEIKFDHTLFKFFCSFLKTNEGFYYLMHNEKYNKSFNEEMAFHLIKKQKIQLLELLTNDNNKLLLEKIKQLIKQIANYSNELKALKDGRNENHWLYNFFGVNSIPLEQYLAQFIPSSIFGSWLPFWDGVNAVKTAYLVNSGIKFYESALGSTFSKLWNYYNKPPNIKKNEKACYYPFFNNPLTSSLLEVVALWPGMSFNPEIYKQRFFYRGEEKDIFWHNDNIITIGDKIHQYQYAPGIFGQVLNFFPYNLGPNIAGIVSHATPALFAIRMQYYSIQSILNQFRSTKNYCKYFFILKKIILHTKQLLSTLLKLYETNKINNEYIIPEIIQIEKIFNNNNKNGLLNTILSWNYGKINTIFKAVYNFFLPGNIAHFYFKELHESEEISILNNFIGAIDIALAKLELLNLKKTHKELIFSIPKLLDPAENQYAVFKARNMWFTALRNTPVHNSLELEKDTKNMMLVSPVAGGKTVFLSTILTELYLANMGIVAAEEIEYTYFTNILNHMTHEYDLGSGISQHLAERKSMKCVKNITNQQKTNEKTILIIDEIYKGTTPQLAVKEAFIDLPPILEKPNIISIITTHFLEITHITENKNYATLLYYLLVDHIAGMFYRTHKLFKDDDNNWWIRNQELGLKYQLAQDKE